MRPTRRRPLAVLLCLAMVAFPSALTAPAAADATLTFTSVADTFVSKSDPTTEYGERAKMWADSTPHQISYVRFDPSGISGSIVDVRLRLYQTDASTAGGRVWSISSDTWSEATNYNTRPTIDGPLLGAFGAVGDATWYELDLGALAVTDDPVSFAIDSTITNDSKWATRESAFDPQLLVDVNTGPTLSVDEVSVGEGDVGTTDATFTVSLSEVVGDDVEVSIGTQDDEAHAPWDYGATNGVLTIPSGALTADFTVPVLGDTLGEGDETFTVTLSGATGASIGGGQGVGTILDDDAPVASTEPKGVWSEPFNVGLPAVHAIVMPNGKVLMVSRPRDWAATSARVLDPGTLTTVDADHPAPQRDLYCAGHTLLPDGRVLLTGGNTDPQNLKAGVEDTDLFDPVTQTWTAGPDMDAARWYPTHVTLPSGQMLIFGGQANKKSPTNTVETYDPTTNSLGVLPTSATLPVGLYPRMHLLPDGRLFHSGVVTYSPGASYIGSTSRIFDPTTNSWETIDTLNSGPRGDGYSVQLSPNEVIAFGGAEPGSAAVGTTEIIDLSEPDPQWHYVDPMNHPRFEGNHVVLPDGTLLAVGGAQGPGSYQKSIKIPELYDPATDEWIDMAAQQAPRMHHSTALLLPDGRVLSAGNDKGDLQNTAEVFSPPYLFKGARPTILSAPGEIGYDAPLSIGVANPATIDKVVLIRAPTVTHSMVFDQRYLPLDFTRTAATIEATGPANAAAAPPGDYMLFVLNDAGVPSVASWLKIS